MGSPRTWAGGMLETSIAGRAMFTAVCALLAWLFFRNAWVADDAYITFRSVEQLFAGNGPRWNPHERVQAFTHPLWFALLAATRVFTRSLYWSSLALSFLLTCVAVVAMRRVEGSDSVRWLLAVALLASSKAFVDYSWSGLETPLAYLLLAWFVLEFLRAERKSTPTAASHSRSGLTTLALIAGLLSLTHPDLVLIVAPALAWSIWRHRSARLKALRELALGLSPVLLWCAFATIYYGTPLPNTAYAKLNTGIPEDELWMQGLRYFAHTGLWDPVTLLTCGVALAAMLRASPWQWMGWGLVAYLAYIVKIGGDFMIGRLFAPAVFVSAMYAASVMRGRTQLVQLVALLTLLNIVVPYSPIRLPRYYTLPTSFHGPENHGIVDEKGVYFENRALRQRLVLPSTEPSFRDAEILVEGAIGLRAYTAGLDRVIIDGHALADPLLARLPASRPWRPGHFWREIPAGYLDSVRDGSNRVRNPQVRRLYDDVRDLTQGPLFSKARLRSMYRLHFVTERPECIDPPCRQLRLHDRFPLEEYRPRALPGGGEVFSIQRRGPEVTIEGRLAGRPEARGQLVFLITTETAASSTLVSPSAEGSGEPERLFVATLGFGGRREAKRALTTLCVATKSIETRLMLLRSPNEICQRLLFPPDSAESDRSPPP